jgi:hypothetical protein
MVVALVNKKKSPPTGEFLIVPAENSPFLAGWFFVSWGGSSVDKKVTKIGF